MAEITLHCPTFSPYRLGPYHALMALDTERREKAVNLLQFMRTRYGRYEAVSLSRMLWSMPEAEQAVIMQSVCDLIASDMLLVAVTPLPGVLEDVA